jgi:hypothetical protein
MQDLLLVNALSEILEQCSSQKYYVVYLNSDLNDASNGLLSDLDRYVVGNGLTVEPEAATFHENLHIHTFQNMEEVRKYYLDNIQLLKSQYGILLFLYSVIMTRVSSALAPHKSLTNRDCRGWRGSNRTIQTTPRSLLLTTRTATAVRA